MDYEKNKLEQKVRELETQLHVSKADTNELSLSYKELVNEKNMLMQQLGHFEKESFEI
jgi:regulator of replication initiation timing